MTDTKHIMQNLGAGDFGLLMETLVDTAADKDQAKDSLMGALLQEEQLAEVVPLVEKVVPVLLEQVVFYMVLLL